MVSRRQHWLVVGGAGSVWSGTNWYLVVQGQYRAFMPVYIEKVEIWSGVTYPSQTTMGLLSLPKIQSLS